MKKALSRGMLLAATALGISYEAPAYAETASGTDDIIVTARRSEERLQDVPISITVFSQVNSWRVNCQAMSMVKGTKVSMESAVVIVISPA